ncbi:MAG: DUF1848 domain-containing protein [Desulfobacteraceae bacterium]|nr:DUF1848 domain-containing protein [Desulfobacteraceae bacterium]
MATPDRFVISASRRTDIPAFYLPWFMSQLKARSFRVINPYNHRVRQVNADADSVHSLVFWSKNFGPFLSGGYDRKLTDAGYNLFFNFTINTDNPILEPHVPPLADRLKQLAELARRVGPQCIQWRFDPVCFYTDADGRARTTADGFSQIARHAGTVGIERCITSFMDHYPKIEKRTTSMAPFGFQEGLLPHKIEILQRFAEVLGGYRMRLYTCCEKEIQDALGEGHGIRPSACIPNDLLMRLFGGSISLKKDRGQRISQGCGCMASVDIGSYTLHPCYHNCLFCYANPSPPPGRRP